LPYWIKEINWKTSKVTVNTLIEPIKNSLEHDDLKKLNKAEESIL
jgi:hypothetical protein